MKRLIYLLVSGLSVISALAQENVPTFEEAADIVPGLQPLIEAVRPFFLKISVLVGGIFGLYFILLLARVYYERKKVKLLKDIRYDLDRLNMHHGVPYSTGKKGFFRRGLKVIGTKLFSRKPVEHKKGKKHKK